jgi:hypothetical protein
MEYAIDPRAGTHFVGKIFVTPHACDRASEHYGVERSKAPGYVMDNLRKSVLISDAVVNEDGRPARMFAYHRMVFVVHPTEPTVYTTYPQHRACDAVRSPLEKIIQRSVKAAERKEQREGKRITIRKAELAIERAGYEIKRAKSESVRVISDMGDKIVDVEAEIARLDAELLEVKREKTNVMKSIAAYI